MTVGHSPGRAVFRELAVVKYGGSALVGNERALEAFGQDILAVTDAGIGVVVVHGAGPQIDDLATRFGLSPRFLNGLRVTDDSMAEVVQLGLLGVVNPSLVASLCNSGVAAVGLSGLDGAMARAKAIDPSLGRVGAIETFDPRVIIEQVDQGRVPVLASAGLSELGRFLNVNADHFAASVAAALVARWFVMMTDVPGLAWDPLDPSSFLSEVTPAVVGDLRRSGSISAGMIPKTEAAIAGLRAGVGEVRIVDAATPWALSRVIVKGESMGTHVKMGDEQ